MSAPDSLVRVSPASDLSELFDPDEADGESQRAGSDTTSDRTDADTAAEQNDPPDTLVVHAPGFGIESAINEVESAVDEVCESAVVRVGEDPDDDPATRESVVFTDLYARYGDRETTVWSRLRDRLDAPEATVAAFVEPYELDWLCRGSASGEASPLSGFDQVVHLRYDADGTTEGGDVSDAVSEAQRFLGSCVDATDKEIRGVLGANRYSHEYEHAPEPLTGEMFGPAMVPEIVNQLPREEWTGSDTAEWFQERLADIGTTGTLREAFGRTESALRGLLSTTTAATADGALTGGAATAMWFALQYAGDDGDPAVLDRLDDVRLPSTAYAQLDAKHGEAPGTVAIMMEFSRPDTMQQVIRVAREGGIVDQIERQVDEHSEILDEYGETLDEHDERLDEHSETLDEHSGTLDEYGEQIGGLRVRLSVVEESLANRGEPEPDGIERVTREDFETGGIHDEHCWRRAFTLAETWAGYPLKRERPLAGARDRPVGVSAADEGAGDTDGADSAGTDGSTGDSSDARQDLTEQLLDTLADGGGAALLGAPGSGKTTATRTTIAAWYRRHDDGTVFYRKQGTQAPLDSATLTEAVESARKDGPVLIAVEDAARRGTYPVYETVGEFEGADDVSVLVNSREGEWRDSAGDLRDVYGDAQQYQDVARVQSEAFTPVDMPPLDAREVERFANNYTEVTGNGVTIDNPEAVLSQILGYEGVSPMLLLAYHLPVWRRDEARANTEVPALIDNVQHVCRFVAGEADRSPDLEADEQKLLKRVALAVNVLNAAEMPVWREHLLGLGTDLDEILSLDDLLDTLQGPLLFGCEEQQYRTHHPLWSELYLSEQLDRASSEARARLSFERCVNGLFALFDDTDRRAAVDRFLTETPVLELTEESPESSAKTLVTNLFGIGEDRPELQPLYTKSGESGIKLPSAGGERVAVEAAFRRAAMFNSRGKSTREREELDWAWKRAVEAGIDDGLIAAKYHARRGHYAGQQGEFETAREHYEQAREAAPGDEESQHEATSLNNLGSVARNLGEYERARQRHQESLEIFREIGDRAGEATSLGNLGLVAESLGEYERARQRHQESLEIFREIGDRAGEATSLGNLGLVAQSLGEYERAREYHEESLEIKQEIGDRAGEAKSLGNLGLVAESLGEYERARQRHQESLEIEQEIGDRAGEAKSLGNLGLVAESLGEYERAREYHEESLEIEQEIGDRAGEAKSLGNLGLVARNLGEYERARECHEESLEIKQEIGNRAGEATSLGNLGLVARNLGEYERAREYHEESLEIKQEIGDRAGEASSLNNLGSVAGEQEDYETAERRHREALAISEELGDRSSVANQQYNVGVDASRQGELERSLEWLQKSRATYADLGVDHRVVRCLESISRIAARLGHTETASEACTDAIELIERSDLDRLAEQAREFRVRRARLDETPQGTLELYSHALGHVLEGEVGTATRLSREMWARRDTHDEDRPVFAVTLAAGVGFAAHLTLAAAADGIDPDDDETPDPDDVLAEIDPAELPTAATSLYHALTRGVPSITPETLREQADGIDPDDFGEEIEILERRAYAELIEALSAGASNKTATDRYKQSLFQIAGDGDSDTAVDTLASLWDERDDHDPGSDAYAAATAAGLLLAGYDSGGEAGVPVDAETVVQRVDPAATPLSDAVRAVYDHLAGDDPDHTPEELHDRVDSLSADGELDQLETVVFASLLSTLTSEDLADYSTTELYRRALVEAFDEDRDVGWMMDLLQRVWERRDDHDSGTDAHTAATAAGILAGVFATGADDTALFVDAETVVQRVDPAATPLSDAARTAYNHLAGDEPGHTVEELRDQIDPPFSDPAVEQLETAVFATVLSAFTNDNTVPTVERYRDTLTDIARGDTDTQTALTELHRVWTQRDDHEPDTDAHAAATAAGVALAAYAELVPDQTDAVVDDPDALPPRGPGDSSRATLPDAVRAVCDHLAGDGPDHTATELKARVDTDTPSGTDAETVVFARLLAALS